MPEKPLTPSGETSTASASQKLAKILSDAQALPDDEINALLKKFPNEFLGDVLVREKILLKAYLQGLMVRALHIPWVSVDGCIVPPNLVDMFTEKFCRDKQLMPLNSLRDTLTIACVNPLDKDSIDEVQYATAYNIRLVMCSDEQLEELLRITYAKSEEEEGKEVEAAIPPPDAIVIEEEVAKPVKAPPPPEPDDESVEERKRLASKLSAQLTEPQPPANVDAANGEKAPDETSG